MIVEQPDVTGESETELSYVILNRIVVIKLLFNGKLSQIF